MLLILQDCVLKINETDKLPKSIVAVT